MSHPLQKYLTFIIFALLLLAQTLLSAQSLPEFKSDLKAATSPAAFDQTFGRMIDAFHNAKINFEDQDVADIVGYARKKKFADTILPKVYGWAATMYGDGRMNEAITYFMESALLYQKQGKILAQSLCFFEIALVQHKASNFREAEEYYTKTLAMAGDSLDHRTTINCYNGLALIERENNRYFTAEKSFRQALRVAAHHRDTAWLAILSGNIGSIHERLQHYDSGLYYYMQNLRLIKNVNEVENEIETYAAIGHVLVSLRKPERSIAYLDSAEQIIRDRQIKFNDFFDPMDIIYEGYALAYDALGDHKKAFHYHQQFHEAFENRKNRINSRSLKQLQLTESFKQKQAQLDMLQAINSANVQIIEQQRYVEVAFIFGILLVSAFAIVVLRTSKQRKRLNRELSTSNAELARLNKLNNKLFSVISHDLRAPLSNLEAILDLYRTGNLAPEDFSALSQSLGHHVKTSGDVLENLLQWARFELSEAKTNPVRLSLREILNRIFLQFDTNINAKSITYHNSIHLLSEAWADENQMEIVFRNLIGNAIKFTEEGGKIMMSSENANGMVRIYVQDTGRGMTPQHVASLFKPGETVTTPGTREEKGTGLGLIISREMILKNKGSIHVESKTGEGTLFIISLPTPPAIASSVL